jgi:hypothetical protein
VARIELAFSALRKQRFYHFSFTGKCGCLQLSPQFKVSSRAPEALTGRTKPSMGVEPMISSLPRKCLTTWPRRRVRQLPGATGVGPHTLYRTSQLSSLGSGI